MKCDILSNQKFSVWLYYIGGSILFIFDVYYGHIFKISLWFF